MSIIEGLTLAIGLVSANSTAKPEVLICMNPGPNAALVVRAQGYASRLFGGIGVRIRWQRDERRCAGGIVMSLAENIPESSHPGALGYALPYERGSRAVVFLDRVRTSVSPSAAPALLAHVMAHEIVHILQGVAQHSETGLMKERWEYSDYVEMQRRPLRVAPSDIQLIERGFRLRSASK
jgi:hypothetical protein